MKKLSSILLGLLTFISVMTISADSKLQPEKLLLQTFQAMGAKPDRYVIHYGDRYSSILTSNMDKFAKQFMGAFRLTTVNKNVDYSGIKYHGVRRISKDVSLEISILNDNPAAPLVKPYIAIQVVGQGKPDLQFTQAYDALSNTLKKYKIVPYFHFTLQGRVNSRHPQLNQPISKVFTQLHVKEIESMKADRTMSISGYSPLFSHSLYTRGGEMNIQVATRFDSLTHQTILTVGTPIITIEY